MVILYMGGVQVCRKEGGNMKWDKVVIVLGVWAAWATVPIVAMRTYDDVKIMAGIVIYCIFVGLMASMLSLDLWRS